VVDDGKELQAHGADAVLLDCIGFTERHPMRSYRSAFR
jgi:hypothetical protein